MVRMKKVNETSRMVATEEVKKKKSSANWDVKRRNIRVKRTPWLRNDFQGPSSPGDRFTGTGLMIGLRT
jgi:hypothetical protein